MTKWYYFGCNKFGEKGHFLFDEQHTPHWGDAPSNFDGLLAPQPETERYVAALSRLGGWGMSALSWWDGSVDARVKSNSIVFAPSLTIEAPDMLDEIRNRFPWVLERLPKPLELLPGTQILLSGGQKEL